VGMAESSNSPSCFSIASMNVSDKERDQDDYETLKLIIR